MKVKFSFVALLLVLVLAGSTVLIGCTKTSSPQSPTTKDTDTAKPAVQETAKPMTLRLITEYSLADKRGEIIKEFAATVEKETKGKVKIEVYPDGQLFKSTEHADALSGGSVDMAVTHFGKGWPQIISELTILGSAPFTDSAQALRTLDGPLGVRLSKLLLEKGNSKLLAWTGAGSVDAMGSRKGQIKKPEDLKGIKMIVPSAPQVAYVEKLGGVGTVISPSERYLALQNGTVDGIFSTTPTGVVTSKLFEPVKYWTRIALSTGVEHGFVINAKIWNGLSADIQKVLTEQSKIYGKKLITDLDAVSEQEWNKVKASPSVQFYQVPAAELAQWQTLLLPARTTVLEKVTSPAVAKELMDLATQVK